jgi:group I intron endonuclease
MKTKSILNLAYNCGLYEIVNVVNHKRYVGSSGNIEVRWGNHYHMLCRDVHPNPYLQAAWNKYGEESFEFRIISECPEHWLVGYENVLLKAPTGHEYNIATDAEVSTRGWHPREETRAKMSANMMGNTRWVGRKHTEESKRKQSEARKQMWKDGVYDRP